MNDRTTEISFSTNMQWVGKPQPTLDGNGKHHNQDNEKIYIGYNWVNVDCSYELAFEMLAEVGVSIAPALTDEAKGHKLDANFASHSLVLIDIDKGMTIEELLANSFYQKYGSGYYTSPNHTEAKHRFRIIFRLEQAITDPKDMRDLYDWMGRKFKAADKACIDACRCFYGTPDAARKEITDRYIPTSRMLAFIKNERDIKAANEINDGKKAKAMMAARKRESQKAKGIICPFELFNQTYSIESLLKDAGYVFNGKQWKAPQSSSYGGKIMNKQGVEIYYAHSHSDPLNGKGHNAFGVYAILKHGGDKKAALKDASEHMLQVNGEPFSVVSKRQYRNA